VGLERAAGSLPAKKLFKPGSAGALQLLKAAWPIAVGPDLARRTEVLAVEGNTLRIRVPVGGWRKVLHRMHRDILSRLYDVAGELTPRRLGFTEISSLDELDAPSPVPVPLLDLSPALQEAAVGISDEKVRKGFLDSAQAYLTRFERRRSAKEPKASEVSDE